MLSMVFGWRGGSPLAIMQSESHTVLSCVELEQFFVSGYNATRRVFWANGSFDKKRGHAHVTCACTCTCACACACVHVHVYVHVHMLWDSVVLSSRCQDLSKEPSSSA